MNTTNGNGLVTVESALAARVVRAPPSQNAIPAKLTVAPTPKTYIAYEFKDVNGDVVYVGRASGKGTPEQVMKGRLAKGHDVFEGNPGLKYEVHSVQGNAAANKGAEGVIYKQRLREGAKLLNDPKCPPLSSKPEKAPRFERKFQRTATT